MSAFSAASAAQVARPGPTFVQVSLPLLRKVGASVACFVARVRLLAKNGICKDQLRSFWADEFGVTVDTVSEWSRRAKEHGFISSQRTGDASIITVLCHPPRFNNDDDVPGPQFIHVSLALVRYVSLEAGPKAAFPVACLVARLELYGRGTGKINPSIRTLAKQLGKCERQVWNLLQKAKKLELLSWKRRKKSSQFTVHWKEPVPGALHLAVDNTDNRAASPATDLKDRPEYRREGAFRGMQNKSSIGRSGPECRSDPGIVPI